MAPVTPEQLQALDAYVAGARPDARGEVEIYCPMHGDSKRSASVNVEKGVWYCHAGCGGGSVRQLLLNDDAWVPMDGRSGVIYQTGQQPQVAFSHPTQAQIDTWHRRLRRDRSMLRWLADHRGITKHTVRKALLGYDGRHLKIPVYSPRRRLWNVRTYDPDPRGGRSKIWNTRGMGKARLYPSGVLARAKYGDAVLFCEGEFDTLLALQHGYAAVTRTDGANKPWHDRWTAHFAGLRVYMCHDKDRAGEESDLVIGDALREVAEVWQCQLPFQYKETSGNDLTDYVLLHRPEDRDEAVGELFKEATPWRAP